METLGIEDRWMDAWMDGQMDEWVDRWMDGYPSGIHWVGEKEEHR